MKIYKFDNKVDMEDWIDTYFGVKLNDGQYLLLVVRSVLMDNGEWETGLFEIGSLVPKAWQTRKAHQRIEAEDDHKIFVDAVLSRLIYKDGKFVGKKKEVKVK